MVARLKTLLVQCLLGLKGFGSFRKLGVPYFGVLIIRIRFWCPYNQDPTSFRVLGFRVQGLRVCGSGFRLSPRASNCQAPLV